MGSFKKEDMGAGLYDGGRTLLKKFWIEFFDFEGKVKPAACCLAVEMVPQDGEMEPFTQHYSMGKGLKPKDGGKGYESVARKKSLNEKSNAGRFLSSLFAPLDDVENGFPQDKVEEDVSVFGPILVDLVRKELPKIDRPIGGVSGPAGAQSKDPGSILMVSQIVTLPWDQKDKKATSTKGKKAPEPVEEEAEAADDIDATPPQKKKATKILMAIVEAAGDDGITVTEAGKQVFRKLKGDDDQEVCSKLVNDEDFLGNDAAPWTFDADESLLKAE